MEKDTVYRGLLRPAKLFGLPLTSAVILIATVMLGFMWAESFWALGAIVVIYPVLYGLAKWDPNFFDVITKTLVSATALPYAARLDVWLKRQGMRSSMRDFGCPSRMAPRVLAI